MTNADLKLVDESIKRHGDDFWNDPNINDGGELEENPNRYWIIVELLSLLAKDDLDLKVIRKK